MAVHREPSLDVILSIRALNKEMLAIVCAEEHCNQLALKITRWKVLCPHIGLKEQDEDNIDHDYKNNEEKKIGMFRVWRQKFGNEATYLCLAEAFELLKWRDRIIDLLDLFAKQSQALRQEQRVPYIPPRLDDKPKPDQIICVTGKSGKEIIIRDQLAGRWEDLCLSLQFEPSSSVASMIKNIERNCRYVVEDCCREVLLKWLSGQPHSSKPVTWRTLIEVMKTLDYCLLAEELTQELLP